MARNALRAAREACPHWDYESDGDGDASECCYVVDEARREYRRVKRRAYAKADAIKVEGFLV